MSARPRRVHARRMANKVPRFQRPELSRPDLVLTLRTARILDPPRRRERAHGQRPMRRRGAIEREALSAGPLGTKPRVSRAGRAWNTKTAWREGRLGGRRAMKGSRSGTGFVDLARPSEASRRRGFNKAQRRGLPDNDRAERSGFVETVFFLQTPDVVRRSATLSIPSAGFRVSLQRRARDHLPPPDRFAVCPPPQGAERSAESASLCGIAPSTPGPTWARWRVSRTSPSKGARWPRDRRPSPRTCRRRPRRRPSRPASPPR
jgi:hypothetical protein